MKRLYMFLAMVAGILIALALPAQAKVTSSGPAYSQADCGYTVCATYATPSFLVQRTMYAVSMIGGGTSNSPERLYAVGDPDTETGTTNQLHRSGPMEVGWRS